MVMEFLKGLEQAMKLGLSKESFIEVWHQESKIKQMEIENMLLDKRLQSQTFEK
ncbi:hypothetical protein Bpfe_002023, partial [Biomphalaria pfeifferi]